MLCWTEGTLGETPIEMKNSKCLLIWYNKGECYLHSCARRYHIKWKLSLIKLHLSDNEWNDDNDDDDGDDDDDVNE